MMSSIGSTTSVCLDWMVDAVLAYTSWREAAAKDYADVIGRVTVLLGELS